MPFSLKPSTLHSSERSLRCSTTAGSPLVLKIPMAQVTFSRLEWTRTSPISKRVEDSLWTPSLVVHGSCSPTKARTLRPVPMAAC